MAGFETALACLKAGARIARTGWNGKGLSVLLQRTDAGSKMTLPYAYIEYPDGTKCPWVPSQTDMLADDWTVLDDGGNHV